MKYHLHIFKMAAERKIDEFEEISDSKNMSRNEFYYLIEQVVMNPSQLNMIVEKLQSVISSLDRNSDLVKFTLKFYKNDHSFPTEPLLIQLFARGVITDADIGKSCFGPFLSLLLFESVTDSSCECAKYSTTLWIDRYPDSISNENSSPTNFPNPLEYLDPCSPTQPSIIHHSVLLQFKLLDDKQRKLVMLDLRKIANLIPPRFYPRIIIAFLIFLEFYKKESVKEKGQEKLVPEICLWAETWHHLILNSLTRCTTENHKIHLPLHHLLNGTMVSSKAFEFISTIPDALHNILKSLRLFDNNSSGFTKKWVSYLIIKLASSHY